MALPVSLRDVVHEMDTFSEGVTAYINRKTGELFTVSDEEAGLVQDDMRDSEDLPEWQTELLHKVREVFESTDFIALPNKFDIHEWSVMDRFASSLSEDEDKKGQLRDVLHGRGAFRGFRALVKALGVEQEWYRYRAEAFEEIARRFLEAHEIPFVPQAQRI
jgi:hypothetical protein